MLPHTTMKAVEYKSKVYTLDEDGRIIERQFMAIKQSEYTEVMAAFDVLWKGSGHLPMQLSQAISHLQAAVMQARPLVESCFGIKTNDHKYAGGLHNRDDVRKDEGLPA